MAKLYLFFKPNELPLAAGDLTADSVSPIAFEEAAGSLKEALPSLAWSSPTEASGEVDEGWVEIFPSGEGPAKSLAVRCSFRSDYTRLVQRLCDQFGWIAFDETPTMFQPQREPQAV